MTQQPFYPWQIKDTETTRYGGNRPGDGWTYQGTAPVARGKGAIEQIPVWVKAAEPAPAPAPAPAPPSGSGLPAPNDGKYENILTNLDYQAKQGADTAASLAKKQPELDPNAAWMQKISDLMLEAQKQQSFQEEIARAQAAEQRTYFNNLLLQQQQQSAAQQAMQQQQLAEQQKQYAAQLSIQQQEKFTQQQQYAAQLSMQQQQLATAQSAYEEQRRQAEALSRAFVPTLQPTAAAPAVGDNRAMTTTTGGGSTGTLSSLSILSGVGLNGMTTNPALAGLQIA